MLWAVNEKYFLKRKKCMDEANVFALGKSVLFIFQEKKNQYPSFL